MATSRNDDKGYERGARGIDGRDGEGFVKWGSVDNAGKVSGDDHGTDHLKTTKSASARQASAKGK